MLAVMDTFIRASLISALRDVAEEHGVAVESLLSEAGLDRGALDHPSNELSSIRPLSFSRLLPSVLATLLLESRWLNAIRQARQGFLGMSSRTRRQSVKRCRPW